MAERTLLSVGYDIPGRSEFFLPFDSDRSLLDGDVIVFQPTFRQFDAYQTFQGKPSFSDDASASVHEHCKRWRHEIKEALKAGKTVFVFLPQLEEVFVHLGHKTFSGTGRNQKVTRIVEGLRNYDALPFDMGTIIPKGGSAIRVVGDLKQLAPYWAKFGSESPYHVYMNGPKGMPILTATSAEAVVGLIIRSGKGTAILLPPVEYDEEKFTGKDKKGQEVWTKEALAFGNQLANALLEIDRAMRAESATTPAPDWVAAPQYRLATELALETALKKRDEAIDLLRTERAALETKITAAASLRDLLYETGKPLERAILKALEAIGFTATPFKEDGSEFDAVFVSSEGRFLGEAEGKNDKAVNIDKLDQLERNIREDFARESTGVYAKGVLFGNAFRLRELDRRPDFFTEKCYAAATRGKVALVRTPDLFFASRYLDEHDDRTFAAACRAAILGDEGTVVTFPAVPAGHDAGHSPAEAHLESYGNQTPSKTFFKSPLDPS
jgi:hypothetical protein